MSITDQHRANMAKLADFLDLLPYERDLPYGGVGFAMAFYTRGEWNCRTAACALGWTYEALDEERPTIEPSWAEMQEHYYGVSWENPDVDNWLFSGAWSLYDDTPQGAAERIRFFLAHGVPESFSREPGPGDEDWDYEWYYHRFQTGWWEGEGTNG